MYWLQGTWSGKAGSWCTRIVVRHLIHPIPCLVFSLVLTLFLGSFQTTGALHSITSANLAECLFFLIDTESVLHFMMPIGPGWVIYLVLNPTFALVDRTWAMCPLFLLRLIRFDATHANDLRVREGWLCKLYERKSPDYLKNWKDILYSWMEYLNLIEMSTLSS